MGAYLQRVNTREGKVNHTHKNLHTIKWTAIYTPARFTYRPQSSLLGSKKANRQVSKESKSVQQNCYGCLSAWGAYQRGGAY